MSQWLEVDIPAEQPKRVSVRGVTVSVFASPYDIPEAVRGFYDRARHRFRIEFRYIEDEPTRTEPFHNQVVLSVGKNSQRIYGIELDVDAMNAKRVRLQIQKAVNGLLHRPPSEARVENYRLVKEAVCMKKQQLMDEMASTATAPAL